MIHLNPRKVGILPEAQQVYGCKGYSIIFIRADKSLRLSLAQTPIGRHVSAAATAQVPSPLFVDL
jgi:hypothetical protein